MGGNQSKNIPLECMIKKLKQRFNVNYEVKLTPNNLKVLCKVHWSVLGIG
jgi:hypothetical protein